MKERKPIPKRMRFEVFKRDEFTCQYCGRKAPDVVLHVDHINPRVAGGSDDPMNLITSCKDCNLGKGPRKLDAKITVEKQRRELENLQERRDQLEMVMEWQAKVGDTDEVACAFLVSAWEKATGLTAGDYERQAIKQCYHLFGADETAKGITDAVDKYVKFGKDGAADPLTTEVAIDKVGAICQVGRISKKKPHMKDCFYIRGILRNRMRLRPDDHSQCILWMENALAHGVKVDEIKDLALTERTPTDFMEELEKLIRL